ncbi:MAG: SUMF1/EgtB/PvdO family nonheme iron enzyme, partial [Verrucomicrobiota bacterium]
RGSEIQVADYEARNLRGDMVMNGKRPLGVGFCLDVGERLAGALAHLHANGLAHRDMKPSNVIFLKGKACLADIGLVAARDQRTFVGTEGFVPPEGPGSAEADVYALGKVIYEMATGKDRLEFPELPDEPIPAPERKKWLSLNRLICDVCEPRLKKRGIQEAEDLEHALGVLRRMGRLRKKRPPVGLAMVSLFVTLGLFVLAVRSMPGLTLEGGERSVVPVPRSSFVTITSSPEGADVSIQGGAYLGVTPYGPQEFPMGAELNLVFRMAGHEEVEFSRVLLAPEMVLGAELKRKPPEDGLPWRDFLGQLYSPEPDGSHLMTYFVGPNEMWSSPVSKGGGWKRQDVSENGEWRPVVFATEEVARRFVVWLEKRSEEDGIVSDRFRMSAEYGLQSQVGGGESELWEVGMRPFRVRIEPVPRALLTMSSEPAGAFVYLDGTYAGSTPLEELEWPPGEVTMTLEREGYEDYEVRVNLVAGEELVLPLVSLKETQGMPWQVASWKNSLGMVFEKVNEQLLVSKWETRVRDFESYLKEAKVPWPPLPDYAQTQEHPAVNVTRDQAEAFCVWLTEREQAEGRIRKRERYRLPTDVEWTLMVGDVVKPGDTPAERARFEGPGYPWEGGFPPEEKVANLAGEEGLGERPGSRMIEGYNDGFVQAAKVGSFPPNEFGLHDLGGNVREWVGDSYLGENGGDEFGNRPLGTTRGGAWDDYDREQLRSGKRRPVPPDTVGSSFGFRVVLAKEDPLEENEGEFEDDGRDYSGL